MNLKPFSINKRGKLEINFAVLAIIAIALITLFVIVKKSYFTTQTGTVDVVYAGGSISRVVDPGPHFKIPFYETAKPFEVITLSMSVQTVAASKDLQPIRTSVTLNHSVDRAKVQSLLQKHGWNYAENIIKPRLYDTVKAVTAQYRSEELLANREIVKTRMSEILVRDLAAFNIRVDSVQVTDFSFSEVFMKSIEDKLKAEQDALRAKYELERVKVEAEQKIAMAKAEAETIQIQAEAIKAQGGQEYVQLKAIEKWDGKLPDTLSGSDIPFMKTVK